MKITTFKRTRTTKSGKKVTEVVRRKSKGTSFLQGGKLSAKRKLTYNPDWERFHKDDFEGEQVKKDIDTHIKNNVLKVSEATKLKPGSKIHYESKGRFITATVKEVKMVRHNLFGSNRKGDPRLTVVTESGKEHPVDSKYLIKKLPSKTLMDKHNTRWNKGRSLMDPRNFSASSGEYYKSYSAWKKTKGKPKV